MLHQNFVNLLCLLSSTGVAVDFICLFGFITSQSALLLFMLWFPEGICVFFSAVLDLGITSSAVCALQLRVEKPVGFDN